MKDKHFITAEDLHIFPHKAFKGSGKSITLKKFLESIPYNPKIRYYFVVDEQHKKV